MHQFVNFQTEKKKKKSYHIPLTPHIMVIQGCLPYTNNPGGNLVHEHNSLELGGWDNNPLQSIAKSTEHTEKSRRIASPQITAHIF